MLNIVSSLPWTIIILDFIVNIFHKYIFKFSIIFIKLPYFFINLWKTSIYRFMKTQTNWHYIYFYRSRRIWNRCRYSRSLKRQKLMGIQAVRRTLLVLKCSNIVLKSTRDCFSILSSATKKTRDIMRRTFYCIMISRIISLNQRIPTHIFWSRIGSSVVLPRRKKNRTKLTITTTITIITTITTIITTTITKVNQRMTTWIKRHMSRSPKPKLTMTLLTCVMTTLSPATVVVMTKTHSTFQPRNIPVVIQTVKM